ncbi:MAG: hypothetical protein K5696_10010 [Lachnospiraceae bacterium]|nr:hypothetical protein [Lachnospiraceae bacterium]
MNEENKKALGDEELGAVNGGASDLKRKFGEKVERAAANGNGIGEQQGTVKSMGNQSMGVRNLKGFRQGVIFKD